VVVVLGFFFGLFILELSESLMLCRDNQLNTNNNNKNYNDSRREKC